MIKTLLSICFIIAAYSLQAQSFELTGPQDAPFRGGIGETIKVPLHFKNTSDKAVIVVIRRVSQQIGTTQKNYFCIDNNCLDAKTEDHIIRLEPNQSLNSVQVALDAGLTQNTSSAVKYIAFNKFNPSESIEFDLNFMVDEKEKHNIYTSNHLLLHDVYPNPITTDHAVIEYSILNERIKAKIVIHDILGNSVDSYPLPSSENKVKIRAEAFNSGIYFYTLYIDNEGIITRKLFVKK